MFSLFDILNRFFSVKRKLLQLLLYSLLVRKGQTHLVHYKTTQSAHETWRQTAYPLWFSMLWLSVEGFHGAESGPGLAQTSQLSGLWLNFSVSLADHFVCTETTILHIKWSSLHLSRLCITVAYKKGTSWRFWLKGAVITSLQVFFFFFQTVNTDKGNIFFNMILFSPERVFFVWAHWTRGENLITAEHTVNS